MSSLPNSVTVGEIRCGVRLSCETASRLPHSSTFWLCAVHLLPPSHHTDPFPAPTTTTITHPPPLRSCPPRPQKTSSKNAEKKASAVSGWFSSAASKQEEAIELFKAAANKFRISNRFEEAGNAYMRAAETELKTGEKDYAANTFFEANKCFRMSRPELAVVALTRAREILIERGRFSKQRIGEGGSGIAEGRCK